MDNNPSNNQFNTPLSINSVSNTNNHGFSKLFKSMIFLAISLIITSVVFVVSGSGNTEIFSAASTIGSDDFENGLADSMVSHQYGTDATFSYVTNNPSEAHSGNHSLKIESNYSVPQNNSVRELTRWLTRIDTIEVTPGNKYRVQAYLKTKNVKDTANLSITFFKSRKSNSWFRTITAPKELSSTTDWTKVSIVFTAPEGAKFMRPEFRLYDKGTLWIDDYAVTNLSKEDNSTLNAVVPAKAPEATIASDSGQTSTEQSTGNQDSTSTPTPSPNDQLLVIDGTYTQVPTKYVELATDYLIRTPSNLTSPLDYASGNAYLRLNIKAKPSNKQVGMQFCLWQKSSSGQKFAGETCSTKLRNIKTTGEYYLDLGAPGSWWGTKAKDRDGNCSFDSCPAFDWSKEPHAVRIFFKEDGTPRDDSSLLITESCGGACYKGGDDINKHLPIVYEANIVFVPKDQTLQLPESWSSCKESWCTQAEKVTTVTGMLDNSLNSSAETTTNSNQSNSDSSSSQPQASASETDSFESGIGVYATHSYNGNATFTHTNSASEAHSGSRSLKIQSRESNPAVNNLNELTRWFTRINAIAVKPGDQYKMDVYLKASNIKDSANFAVTFFSSTSGSSYVGTNISGTSISGNQDWTKASITVVVPRGASYMRPEFRLFDKGTLLIDDFTISKVKSSQTTNTSEVIADEEPIKITTESSSIPTSFDSGQYKINFGRSPVLSTYWKPGLEHKKRIFTIFCDYSHSLDDDPIVFPKQPGRSHKHDFLGNNALNAYTTPQTVLDSGVNSCRVPEDRSAYWVPSVYDHGRKINPASSKFYYRAGYLDPSTIQPMPVGLMMIAGNANSTSNQSSEVGFFFTAKKGPLSSPSTQRTEGRNSMIQTTASEQGVRLDIHFPNCWDGKNLWLPGSKHVTYSGYPPAGKQFATCPASHPVPIIAITFNLHYPEADGGPDFRLSSGPWYTFHGDFINGWHPGALKDLTEGCIRSSRYCQAVDTSTCDTKFANGYSPVPVNTCLQFQNGQILERRRP